jgi:ribosomal protein S18 acetylase RimI-like enzyme
VIFREANTSDCSGVGVLHKKQFHDHVLGLLSPRQLEKFYIANLALGAKMFVAEEGGTILGFVLGGEAAKVKKAKKEFLYSNLPGIALKLIGSVGSWIKIAQSASAMFARPKSSSPKVQITGPSVWLLSIAIDDSLKSKGAAKKLVELFDEWVFRSFGKIHYRLSVQKENTRAIRFYEKCGFIQERTTGNTIVFGIEARSGAFTATRDL